MAELHKREGATDVGYDISPRYQTLHGSHRGVGRALSYRRNELMELLFELRKMESHVSHIFRADGDSTQFTRRAEVQPRGFLKIMQPMMKGMLRKRNVGFLATLKTLVESS